MADPEDRPPLRVVPLVAALAAHRVEYVLSGSVVLVAYGADLSPGDLDVVPATDPDNLHRLAAVLGALGAVPAYLPGWADGPTLAACRAWRPMPATVENLDHLFVTPLGMLDVPPTLTGTFAELRPGATRVDVAGTAVWLCDPQEVLRRIDGRGRAKDLRRATAYAATRKRLSRDPTPVRLDRLL
jgi:hypothetical protein